MDSSDSETRLNPSSPGPASAQGGFAPGFAFTERYRIVSLLGRGAMGEVYRADDLRLEQPVALKFLPEGMTHDAEARDRLFAEARNARSVAHPNVCRVYDIGEFNGRVFLTMEDIDGEDLASLLRRIGRLPGTKALEIARQVCAGLAAAHERGILHRDLKPSNVMIDGRGTARITDFGLAVNAERASPADVAGTMPYMAPERFRGAPATVQSDVYALGLILYETFTGQRAFNAPTATLEEWRSVHDSSDPTRPVTLANDIDAATERAILRCLEKDPARRPASAARVAASLPGGDPLAAALAAGETPSPALVAASGSEGTLPRRVAWAWLAVCAVSLFVCIAAGVRYSLVPKIAFAGSPEVLRAKARTVLGDLGYTDAARDHAWWFVRESDQLEYLARTGPPEERVRSAASAVPTPLAFQYRQSPRAIESLKAGGVVTADSPALAGEGDALVQLDAAGRLTYLQIVPPPTDPREAGRPREPDWSVLIAQADLRNAALADGTPRWVPPTAFDIRKAWTGTLNGEPVRFEAAAYGGRVVFAKRSGAWNDPDVSPADAVAGGYGPVAGLAEAVLPVLWIVVLGSVALLARRHVRLGRGDRRGALRVAAFVLAVGAIADMMARHWVFDSASIWTVISRDQGRALFNAALVWLCYLGLEPFVRRSAPHLLIGWTRLIGGQWRDPLVGQRLIAGVLLGTLWPLVSTLPLAAAPLLHLDGAQLRLNALSLAPAPAYLSTIAWSVLNGVINALALVAFMVAARFVLRNEKLVLVATAAVTTLAGIMGVRPFVLDVAQAVIIGVAAVWFIKRFGLLALVTGLAINWAIRATPWTADPSAWFAWRSGLTAALVLGVALWGFLNVLGRQSLVADAGFDG